MQKIDHSAGKIVPIPYYMLFTVLLVHALALQEPAVTVRELLNKYCYQFKTTLVQHQKRQQYEREKQMVPEISKILYRLPQKSVAESNARDVAPLIHAFVCGPDFKNYRAYTQKRIDAWDSAEEQAQRAAAAELFRQKFPACLCMLSQFLQYALAVRTALAAINRLVVQPLDAIIAQNHRESHHEGEDSSPNPPEPEDEPSLTNLFMLMQFTYFFWKWNHGLQMIIAGRGQP